MNIYEICKLYVEWYNIYNPSVSFIKHANITKEEKKIFFDFMRKKYGNWNITKCKEYIKFIEYIKTRIAI